MASPQAASPALASSPAASPAATAIPKVSTPTKSTAPAPVVSPISSPQVTSAPAPSSPQATTVPTPISVPIIDSSTQHASVSQAAKSVPTSVASPNPIQPGPPISTGRPKSISGTPANAPVADTNGDTSSSPDTLSDAPSGSKSVVGPVIGSIFAVLLVIIAVVGGVWYLQRRREKARMRHEAKRMRSSNFGLYETGDVGPEKQASIEATLEADLARLRNLDANIPIIVDDYDSKYPERPSISLQPQPAPSLQIARKPSYLAKNSYKVASSNIAGSKYAADSSPSAPAYFESTESKDYAIGGGGGGGGGICHSPTRAFPSFNTPASSLSVKPIGVTPVFPIDEAAHHPTGLFAPEPKSDDGQKSDSIEDFQRWCSKQGHIEPSSFDHNSWPQSPSLDSSNREISPLSMAVQSSFSMPHLPSHPLPPHPQLPINQHHLNPLEFTIHNVNIDSNRKPITLSVDPPSALSYLQQSGKLV